MNALAPVKVGMRLGGRYRVDLVLSADSTPALLATRFPDGTKVLIQLIRHSLTQRNGPLIAHLMRDARVAHLDRADLLRIHEFGIDDATQERFLVVDYDRSRTAAQIVDPDGRERRTVQAFLQVAQALVDQYQQQGAATRTPATDPHGAEPLPADAPEPPGEDWVEVDAKEIIVPVADRVSGLKTNDLVWLVGLIATGGVAAAMIFADERAVEPPPVQYPWYHNYSNATAFAGESTNDPFGNDPDVIAARGMRITLRSNPSSADVYDGLKRLGRTPVAIARPKMGAELSLRVSKAGYGETSLSVSYSSPAELSVTIGGGSIGDETAKFIKQLKSQNNTAFDELKQNAGSKSKVPGAALPDPSMTTGGSKKKGNGLYDD